MATSTMESEERDRDDLVSAVSTWLGDTLSELDVRSAMELSPHRCMQQLKEKLAKELLQALVYVENQNDLLRNVKCEAAALKTELIRSQEKVIALQAELLDAKTEQLKSLQISVRTSVEDTVKAELKSFSDVVQTPSPAVEQKALKTVVKHIVEEEDRSRSLMMFGLPEEVNEQLCDKVSEVFQELGEKPRLEASRLGTPSSGKVRPVKINVTSAATVHQILIKARNLNQSVKHKSVFISPDRTPAQRAEHRLLVVELKRKTKEDKSQRHYIKGGQVCSADIVVT